MNKPHKIAFISDLHLDENCPEVTRQFRSFIDQLDDSYQAIYILGDLFEAWIGDDDHSHFYLQIASWLKQISDKMPVYILPGNRDFLLGKQFAAASGCQIISDPTVVNIYGEKVLLMHGDSLCTLDRDYVRFRKIVHNRFIRWIFLRFPLSFRRRVASQLRKQSGRYTQQKSAKSMDVVEAEIVRALKQHDTQLLIHGHTHRPGMHQHKVNGQCANRIVLGAWHDASNILIWEANGRRTLLPLATL